MLQEKDPSEMSAEELEKALTTENQPTQQAVGESEPAEEETPEEVAQEPSESEPTETEIDVEPVSPTKESVKKGDPVSGLKKDVAHERERRRQAEEKARLAEQQLANLNARLAALEKPVVPAKNPLDELGDDDIVPAGLYKQQANKLQEIERKIALQEQEVARRREKEESDRRQASDKEAREKYSADKVGEEYSYARIVSDVLVPIIESGTDEGSALATLIMKSVNPAETAYRYGLSKVYDPLKATTTAKTIKKPAPVTLGQAHSAGGNKAELSEKDIASMSDAELDKYFASQGR